MSISTIDVISCCTRRYVTSLSFHSIGSFFTSSIFIIPAPDISNRLIRALYTSAHTKYAYHDHTTKTISSTESDDDSIMSITFHTWNIVFQQIRTQLNNNTTTVNEQSVLTTISNESHALITRLFCGMKLQHRYEKDHVRAFLTIVNHSPSDSSLSSPYTHYHSIILSLSLSHDIIIKSMITPPFMELNQAEKHICEMIDMRKEILRKTHEMIVPLLW